jgi:hypothetical protein
VKRIAALGVLIFLVPMFQSAVTPYLSAALCPDLSLLLVMALALCWRSSASGLLLAATSGVAVDLFSGGLAGQHVLLQILTFVLVRVVSVHVNLLGSLPQMLFAALMTAGNALGLMATTAFFSPGTGAGLVAAGLLAVHASVNALVAPLVIWGVARLVGWLSADDAGRRVVRLEPRGWAS